MSELDTSATTNETTAPAAAPGLPAADLADAAANPSSFSVDGLSQNNRSLSELIALDNHLRKVGRASRPRRHPLSGMVSHLIPPGTCDR